MCPYQLVTVVGDRAVLSRIMQIVTSAVNVVLRWPDDGDLWSRGPRDLLSAVTQGFLSILVKQFTCSDLNLFEILQEPSMTERSMWDFKRNKNSMFQCAGLLGLSSVGLSTKGGVQTLSRVLVHDGLWRFSCSIAQLAGA